MSKIIDTKCELIFRECDKHIMRIKYAANKISLLMPMDTDIYNNLNENEISYIDQFLFRFSKLQDTIGEKLFTTILYFLQEENIEKKPFIDILNRLEKLNLLEDKNQWLYLREVRNNLTHEYDDDANGMSLAINNIYIQKDILFSIYYQIRKFYFSKIK